MTNIFAALFDQAAAVTSLALLVFTAIYAALFGYWCWLVCELLYVWSAQAADREREDDASD